MLRLSVIIPCYNLEQYIGRCLETVLDQNIPANEFEIILIDDGSTDQTPVILKEIADKHSNIRLISQKNMGVATARNTGIALAQGEYIWFVDGDDWIVPQSFAFLLEQAELYNADILRFNHTQTNHFEKAPPFDSSKDPKLTFYSPSDFFIEKIKRKFFLVCQLLRREIIIKNNLTIPSLIICEDVPFLGQYIIHAEKIVAIDIPFYYYYNRQGSAVNTINKNRAENVFEAYNQLWNITASLRKNKQFAQYMKRLIMTQVANEFRIYRNNGTAEDQEQLLKSYKKSKIRKHPIVLSKMSLRKVLFAITLKFWPDHFFKIWRPK